LSPEFTATVNLTQPLVSTIAVTNSPLPVTKTVEPSATATQLITPSPTVLPTEIADAKGVQMVLVPAREFTMGSDNAAADERSAHSVSVDTFYMDRFEVTNQLYSACVSAGICQNPTHNYLQGPDLLIFIPQGGSTQGYEIDNYYSSTQYANFPVVFVSWSMAKTYCEWRDARLPTEAEWEKAARGTEGKIYPWGNDFDCHFGNSFDFTSNSPVRALYGPRCDKYIGTSPVGQFPGGVSSYGVYDLSGNVWEWVSSLYKPYPYKNSNAENSQEVGLRVFRGGSFLSSAVNSRSSKRQSASENYSATDLGFRCAKDATP
jgi:formylglycine-generating enzyme required for sulfatase activity